MALPDRFTAPGAPEPVTAFRPGIYNDDTTRNKLYPQGMTNMVLAPPANPAFGHIFQHMPPLGPASPLEHGDWVQVQSIHNRVTGVNGFESANGLVPVTSSSSGGSGADNEENGPANLDVDFSRLGLTRKSKALKLISPATNAPIKPEDSGKIISSPEISDSKLAKGADVAPDKAASFHTGKCVKELKNNDTAISTIVQSPSIKSTAIPNIKLDRSSAAGDSAVNEPVSPTSGLPIRSKLRRWMVSPRVDGSRTDSEDLCGDTADEVSSEAVCEWQGPSSEEGEYIASSGVQKKSNRSHDDIEGYGKQEASSTLGADMPADPVNIQTGDTAHNLNYVSDEQVGDSDGDTEGNKSMDEGATQRTEGGGSIGPTSSGIPRDSRLRMWMAKEE